MKSEHTVKPVISIIVSENTLVNEYIKTNHISSTSAIWDLLIEVDSFKVSKGREIRKVIIVEKIRSINTEISHSHHQTHPQHSKKKRQFQPI